MSLYLGNNLISGSHQLVGESRNIGQIIKSTIPLVDAGLHLLDGSLIQGGGIYSNFVTQMAGMVSTAPDCFCSESDWQTSVTTYGVCGKFVYDSVNNTIRLPKITGFIEGTIDPTTLGDLTEAGLPDHRHKSWGTPGGTGWSGSGANNGEYNTTYASEDNPIYGKSDTVQPQSIKVLYYIVIATSTKTNIEVDIDEIATDLNGKADVDLNNCTKPHIVETYHNGTSWYRVYSDGWCEQGGQLTTTNANTTVTVNLLKTFVDINYTVNAIQFRNDTTGEYNANVYVVQKYTSSIAIYGQHPYTMWQACGYIR